MALLTSTWRLRLPQVVISVAGCGHRLFDEKQILVVQRGLTRALRTTSAWLVTGGLADDVTSVVCRARVEAEEEGGVPVTCLGLASWREVRGRDTLEARGGGQVR